MGVTPLTFTGTSQYASDFQSILNRAVGIASIPLTELEQSDQTDLTKKTQLGSLQQALAGLTSAVQNLGTVASGQAIAASSSNSNAVAFQATGATQAATYTVNSVTSLATAASEDSTTGYASSTTTPVSANGTLSLVVGSTTYPIALNSSQNNLVGLVNAINNANAGVTASIITAGTSNYLTVSANNTGQTTLQLLDQTTSGNTNVLTDSNQGTNAVFELNNIPVTRTQNTVNDLISGASLDLTGTTTSPVTLTLAPSSGQLSSAIQSFVSAYNQVVSQVNSQTGTSGGALVGDASVLQTESVMQQLTTYQGSGSIQNLSDMGITLNSDGTMSFDPTVLPTLSQSQLQGALNFFGSQTTGFGGLWQNLDQVSDPVTGTILDEENSLTQEDQSLQTKIQTTTDQINQMQQNLLLQLSQADTLISTLDSQQNALNASIESLQYVTYGKPTTSSSSTG